VPTAGCSVIAASTDPCPPKSASSPVIKVGFLLNQGTDGDTPVEYLEEYAQHIVDLANDASACTFVKARFALGMAQQKSFAEPLNEEEYITDFKECSAYYSTGSGSTGNGECKLKPIYKWRKDSKSDIVVILSRMELEANFAVGHSKYLAFAVVAAESAATYTPGSAQLETDLVAVHELGHILGAAHDPQWFTDNPSACNDGDFRPVCSYSHGYYRDFDFCTIMSASDCLRDVWWSTPKISLNGTPIGSCDKEDVARTISDQAESVSHYR
jgi:Metallo-peptidase family M12